MCALSFEQLYEDLVDAMANVLPNEYFTLARFKEDTGMSDATARRHLNTQVESGELETMLANVDGCQQRIYWFTEDNE